jgi:hypothetical protein
MFAALSEALVKLGYDKFDLFSFHPVQLASYLEVLWELRRRQPPPKLVNEIDPSAVPDAGLGKRNDPIIIEAAGLAPRDYPETSFGNPIYTMLDVLDHGMPSAKGNQDLSGVFRDAVELVVRERFLNTSPGSYWHHLIYAYLIENTRSFEVFERVLVEAISGEKLGFFDQPSHRWVRATEELFFRSTSPMMLSIVSDLRPDVRATRRNAYFRTFGMELNHGKENGPYPFTRPEANNQDFVSTFEQFLREVWRGHVNASNTSGPNTTDNSAIAFLATRLSQMLRDRRENGNLTREEFVSVATLNWFDFTLSDNTPIVLSLKAEASSPEERLRKVAQRVNLAPHSKARSLFELSWRVSALLIQIERGAYNNPDIVPVLYTPSRGTTPPNPVAADMVEIIIHWSIATGRDLKSVPVSATGYTQPQVQA